MAQLTEEAAFTRFVNENLPESIIGYFNQQHVEHIVHCVKLLKGEIESPGSAQDEFIEALACRDFYTAFKLADNINQIAMRVYASYMYNYAPSWSPRYIKPANYGG